MPLPAFAAAVATTRPSTLTRTQAAGRLGLHPAGVDKLIRAGIFPSPMLAASVDKLAARQPLEVLAGELTVLRADERATAYPGEDREHIGFHAEYSDAELEETSLRWWRSDPERILANELFAVTVSTFPVAVYRIVDCVASHVREGEVTSHHHYAGELLGRVYPEMAPVFPQGPDGHLRELARRIMRSRIVVASGGPIGYLEAPATGSGALSPHPTADA
jgi:hypothetical protein